MLRICKKELFSLQISSTFQHKFAYSTNQPEACNFNKKETLVQVFFCEYCETFQNIFSYRIPVVATSVFTNVEINIKANFASNLTLTFFEFNQKKTYPFLVLTGFISKKIMYSQGTELKEDK